MYEALYCIYKQVLITVYIYLHRRGRQTEEK